MPQPRRSEVDATSGPSGAPKETIRVWIHDVPKEHRGIAGVSPKDLGR